MNSKLCTGIFGQSSVWIPMRILLSESENHVYLLERKLIKWIYPLLLKSHSTWIFYSHVGFFFCTVHTRYTQLVKTTKDYHLQCLVDAIHSYVIYLLLFSLPNPLITHDKTQQRDKIAVKINDLKQKHSEPNGIRANASAEWERESAREKMRNRAMWMCFEVHTQRSAHIAVKTQRTEFAAHITQST